MPLMRTRRAPPWRALFLSGSAKKADLRIGNLVQILALAADLGKSVLALFPPKAWWLRRRLLTVIFSAELESKRNLTKGGTESASTRRGAE